MYTTGSVRKTKPAAVGACALQHSLYLLQVSTHRWCQSLKLLLPAALSHKGAASSAALDGLSVMFVVTCRQSLPPHAQSYGPGVAVTRKVYTPNAAHGRAETSLSKRTAYSEVLRRVRSAHGTPTPVKAQQRIPPVEALGPWPD